jgi:enolase-phosphatase E1
MRAVLLDIEGTTTPISFVHDVLFPYSRDKLNAYLKEHGNSPDVQSDLARLNEEHDQDVTNGLQPAALIESYFNWLIDRDRKSAALKSLQGKIWEQGYRDGSLQAPLFPDVLTAMERWQKAKVSINIFSSGSVFAQKLLFAHTVEGDLSSFIDNYFDTSVGKKNEPDSYRNIATAISLATNEIHFVSDVVSELEAAQKAGLNTTLCARPGNPVQPMHSDYRNIRSFDEIES